MGTGTTEVTVMRASVRLVKMKGSSAELPWQRGLSKVDVHALRVCTGYAQKSNPFSSSLAWASRISSMRDRLDFLYIQSKIDGAKGDEMKLCVRARIG